MDIVMQDLRYAVRQLSARPAATILIVLVGVGMVLGLAAAWGLGRLVGAQLYGVTPNDPVTIAAAAGILAAVSLAAGYIPALRATRVNPVFALRYE